MVLPPTARLLPPLFPLSIILLPLGSITEFFRVSLPVVPTFSEASSPTLGNALEFLNGRISSLSRPHRIQTTYRFVIPLRFVGFLSIYCWFCVKAFRPIGCFPVVTDPPPGRPLGFVFGLLFCFLSKRKLEKSNLFSSSSFALFSRSSCSLALLSISNFSRAWLCSPSC